MNAAVDRGGPRAQIADLVAEHAWVLDRGDPRRLPDLYRPDGQLLGLGEPIIGREALERWADARAKLDRVSRHVHTNQRSWQDPDGVWHGSLITLLWRHDGPGDGPAWPQLVLDYDDVYDFGADGRCRFARRQISRVFVDRARVPR
jgi:hypothetical protein